MTIRIGILGAAAIAPNAMITPATEVEGVEVTAVAARDPKRAQAFAAEHAIASVEPDYRALCHSELVDAVYVALPASHHKPWSIEAMRAGKDVLCEKPLAMNAVEAAEMVAVADETGRLLMEAFHWRYHPLANRMKEVIDGDIGEVRSLSATFSVPIDDPTNIRYNLELGGGALMDLGCYPLQWVRFIAGGEPTITAASATQQPEHVDVSLSADMRFEHRPSLSAQIHCSMAADTERVISMVATGTTGTVTVTNPLAPHRGNNIEVLNEAGTSTESIESESTYHHQLLAFAEAVRTRRQPATAGDDSIASMAAIDACYRAAGMMPRGMSA